ncbi:MAG: hypothetical protein LBE31_02965 [Deltaproteobacteria bacterium]|nr:hypothetical protein [Deltaproteobacteria bacterium]
MNKKTFSANNTPVKRALARSKPWLLFVLFLGGALIGYYLIDYNPLR